MQDVDANAAAHWLAAHGWAVVPADQSDPMRVRGDAKLTRHCVQVDRGDADVGCNMASVFLHDVDPAAFAGGLLWVSNIFPGDADDLRFARRVIRGCGAVGFEWGRRWFFQLEAGERDVAQDLLALALMFRWDAALFVAGRRLVVEADHDRFPPLIAGRVSDHTAGVMTRFEAEVTPWPFRSRFLCA